MKKLLQMMFAAGLIAGMLVVGGCGDGGGGPTLPVMQKAINGNVSVDASGQQATLTLAAGEYTATIANLGADDTLVFPAGVDGAGISVDNSSYTDGKVTMTRSTAGGIVTVVLTGLTADQDKAINAIADVNKVLGATVTQ